MAESNSFGTFLETRDQLRKSRQPAIKRAPGGGTEEPSSGLEPLTVLANTSFPVAMGDLVEGSDSPVDLVEALGRLEKAGLVAFEEADGHKVVALTEQGASLKIS
jgi:hypothetical protein